MPNTVGSGSRVERGAYMFRSGVVKGDKTIELKGLMPFEVGQYISLAIFPHDEERAGTPEAILEATRHPVQVEDYNSQEEGRAWVIVPDSVNGMSARGLNSLICGGIVKSKAGIELDVRLSFPKGLRVNLSMFPYVKGQYEGSPEELRDIVSQPSMLTSEDFDEFERLIEEGVNYPTERQSLIN